VLRATTFRRCLSRLVGTFQIFLKYLGKNDLGLRALSVSRKKHTRLQCFQDINFNCFFYWSSAYETGRNTCRGSHILKLVLSYPMFSVIWMRMKYSFHYSLYIFLFVMMIFSLLLKER